MNRPARTAEEVVRIFERLTAQCGPEVAESWIGAKGYPRAADAARKARKKAKRTAETARIGRQITETLAASQAPQPAREAGAAPVSGSPGNEDFAAMGAGLESPFWRQPGSGSAVAPEAAKPLHEMDAEEFRAYAGGALGAYGQAAGLGSPVWQ